MNRIIAAACLVVCTNAGAMTFTLVSAQNNMVVVDAVGPIEAGDALKLKAAYEKGIKLAPTAASGSPLNRMVRLHTPGGDLYEAMRIGRWVREKKMAAVVASNSQCYSSCVYILAAGVVKIPDGNVGIHRPYLLKPPTVSVDAAMKKALQDSRSYFDEMNIPSQLADTMFTTPPARIQVLGNELLSTYRLNEDDFGYSEESDMQQAARYGMSRQDYIIRRQKFEVDVKQCDSIKATAEYIACFSRLHKEAGFIER